jgi:hypothetical protein
MAKIKNCIKCKQRAYTLKCKCNAGSIDDVDLMYKYYKKGDNAVTLTERLNKDGWSLSKSAVHHKLPETTLLNSRSKEVLEQKIEALDKWLSSLKKRPTAEVCCKKFKISYKIAYRHIQIHFGQKQFKSRGRKICPILKGYLEEYKEFEKNKTFPTPCNIVQIMPVLSRNGLI